MLLFPLHLALLAFAILALAGPVLPIRHGAQVVQGLDGRSHPRELPGEATTLGDPKRLSRRAGEEQAAAAKGRKFPSLQIRKKFNCQCCKEKTKQSEEMPIHCKKICAACVRLMTTMAMEDPKQWPPECCPKHPIPKDVSLPLLDEGGKDKYHEMENSHLDDTLKPEQRPDCIACGDKVKPSQCTTTACGGYCPGCLKTTAMVHANDEAMWPPKCCRKHERIPDKQILKHLPPNEKALYQEKSRMYSIPAKDRFFCNSRNCGKWFEPASSKAGVAQCPWCLHEVTVSFQLRLVHH